MPYYTETELAQIMHQPKWRIHDLVQEGKIKVSTTKVGLISAETVRYYLEYGIPGTSVPSPKEQ